MSELAPASTTGPQQDPAQQFRARVSELCATYLTEFPDESERLAELRMQLSAPDVDLSKRSTIPEGHMCASAVVVSRDGSSLLMVEHKTLGMWVVPGGHYDEVDHMDLAKTAAREFEEETGSKGLSLHPWHEQHGGIPLDIDTHHIPANPKKTGRSSPAF